MSIYANLCRSKLIILLRLDSIPGRASIFFDVNLALASPVKPAGAKIRSSSLDMLGEGNVSPDASINQGSPAARKLDLEERPVGGDPTTKETAFSSPGLSLLTRRYEPSGSAWDSQSAALPMTATLIVHPVHQDAETYPAHHTLTTGGFVSPAPRGLLGGDALLGKVEVLRGQVSQIHR
jgi:hypothetical protein